MTKLLRASRAKGRLAIALGDFNMIPSSLAHQLISTHGPAVDTWKVLHPYSSVGSTLDESERARGVPMPTAHVNLTENGTTCDSCLNTWRWSEQHRKALKRGELVEIDLDTEDPRAKRLDYVFLGGKVEDWKVVAANVGMVERHHSLKVSLSDHFSVEVTIQRAKSDTSLGGRLHVEDDDYLPIETYNSILEITDQYIQRERSQRRYRMGHLGFGLGVSIMCLVAVWWSPHNFVSFLLMLVSSLSLSAGAIDGLIGGLFMSWELRSLKEFKWEIGNLKQLSRTEIEDVKAKYHP
jgi:sphingomyelin phosphodiesterase 2